MDRRLVCCTCCLLVLALAGCGTVADRVDSIGERADSLSDGDHPFAGETVTVAVDGTARERALVADGLEYWAGNATRYAGFAVDFRVLATDATRAPDVQMEFVETVTECGETAYPAGCAPRLTAATGLDRPASVEIRRGLANESTRLVVAHEAGHLLGLSHDDRPHDVMAHERDLATLPRPDATERAMPWNDSSLTVALADDGDRDRYREELAYALAYLGEGADGAVPANVTFSVVTAPDAADVVVRPVSSAGCADGDGSCLRLRGTDPDRDGVIETYTHAEILLVGLDADAASWHVARQLAGTFHTGVEPVRLAEADADERRGAWHG